MMLTRLPGHSCKRAILYMGIARAVSPRASSVQSGQWGGGGTGLSSGRASTAAIPPKDYRQV